jgi:hypothetical protein
MNENSRQKGTYTEPVCVTLTSEIDFEEALSQAINEGLATISTIVTPVLRAYLDDAVTYEIGRMKARSTIKDIRTLQKGLEKMFGFGAKVFEKKILESLYAKLSLTLETRHNLSFVQAVRKAEAAFARRLKNEKNANSKRRSLTKSGGNRKH